MKSHLVVAESDGEPPIVAIDDLNAVVSRAAGQRHDILGQIFLGYYSSNLIFTFSSPDIHHTWAAGNHLPHVTAPRLVEDPICECHCHTDEDEERKITPKKYQQKNKITR